MRGARRLANSLVVVSVALLVVGVACSKSSSTATPPGNGSGVTLQQGGGGNVFSPATLTVAKGDTINVSNVGDAPHTFTVTGQSIDVTNDPGKSQSVTIDLPAGTYPFVCRFHEAQGMKGTLTVTG